MKTTFAGLGVGAGFASNLATFNAFAAGGDDYKALVCVFLFGGMDAHDTIIPFSQSSYNKYEQIRDPLLSLYDQVSPRRRSRLLELSGDIGGQTFAMPPEMAPIHELYQRGDAAIVGNVGPLIEQMNRKSFRSKAGRRPAKLFSHNDQQSTWMASRPEGASTGWGGRFADIIDAADMNTQATFANVSIGGQSIFLSGERVQPFITSSSGPSALSGTDNRFVLGSDEFNSVYEGILRGTADDSSNLFRRDIADITNHSLNSNALLSEMLDSNDDMGMSFPDTKLSLQLRMVARMIGRRESLSLSRQIFFVSLGGFDTHSAQATKLPALQQDLAVSLRAFYDSLVGLGMQNNVTTFTASDFGRTLGVNDDGTDHGWGSHHLVIGGGVNGGRMYGDIPPPELGHNYDAGRGRLIPSLSVDQYAGALGRWFGLSDGELVEALPAISRFDQSQLSALFG